MYKLSVLNIVIEAFWQPWKYKLRFFNMLALPLAMVVGITTIWSEVNVENISFNLFFYLIYIFSVSYFAVKCHRFILISNNTPSTNIPMIKRVIAFLLWIFVVYIVVGIVLTIFMTIGMNTFADAALMKASYYISDNNFSLLKLLLILPAGYILARLSLVFPAIAIDKRASMKWAWKASQNNGLRMLVLIGVLPWMTTILLNLLWRENGTMFEYVFLSILGYIVLAIEVFILSIAYREIQGYEIQSKRLSD